MAEGSDSPVPLPRDPGKGEQQPQQPQQPQQGEPQACPPGDRNRQGLSPSAHPLPPCLQGCHRRGRRRSPAARSWRWPCATPVRGHPHRGHRERPCPPADPRPHRCLLRPQQGRSETPGLVRCAPRRPMGGQQPPLRSQSRPRAPPRGSPRGLRRNAGGAAHGGPPAQPHAPPPPAALYGPRLPLAGTTRPAGAGRRGAGPPPPIGAGDRAVTEGAAARALP
ncbi:basic salivary proline-rich protein 1-like [Apus apus]|uniref:basic salivary proline-rich protein 1-like n=1 Tax=Apus apus TaxID=8895 RepID=UPI0021F88DF5|nr:basic salivary proline-rich protein 1-like [Apus apus]